METNVDKGTGLTQTLEEAGAERKRAAQYSVHDAAQLAGVRKKFRKIVKGMKRKDLEAMQRWLKCEPEGHAAWLTYQLDKALSRKNSKAQARKIKAVN